MKRFAENQLEAWLGAKDRKPLIIRGARQVGKSTLVKNLARAQSLELVEINLEKTKLKSADAENFDIAELLSEIEVKANQVLTPRSLVFLDEIQAQPKLLERLRYFYEDRPDIKIIAAGSLLDIFLEQTQISFPVGRVSFFHLGPMSFCEFLIACKKNQLAEAIEKNQLRELHHDLLLTELKKFYYVGGMPKAVLAFSETQSLLEIQQIHRDITQTYLADFSKYGPRLDLHRLEQVFYAATKQLGKKLIYQHLDRDSKSIENKKCIELLIKARLLIPCYHADAQAIPLKASRDLSIFKLFYLDIGLVNHLQGLGPQDMQKMFDEQFSTKGFLAEQFIAQHLAYVDAGVEEPSLMYWLRDRSAQKAEIDFLIQRSAKIIPIEVKAQSGGKLRSLIQFAIDNNCQEGYKFSKDFFSTETIKLPNSTHLTVQSWPLYAVEALAIATRE